MKHHDKRLSLSVLLKLFLLVVSVQSLLLFGVGAVLSTFDGEWEALGFLAINLGVLAVSAKIGVIVHELGHWCGARLVGEYPCRLKFGKGHVILRTHFFKTKLTIYHKLREAHIITIFSDRKNYRIRKFIYVVMGPMANLLLAGLFFLVFPLSSNFAHEVCIGILGCMVNGFLFLGNLWPHKTRVHNIPSYSDGLLIWNLLFSKKKQDLEDHLLNDFMDAEDALYAEDYNSALQLFEACLAKVDDPKLEIRWACIINAAICKGQLGDLDGYFTYLKRVEEEFGDEIPGQLAGPLYQNLALVYFLKDQLEDAGQYMRRAMKFIPDQLEVRLLHGTILIVSGKVDEGIEVLVPVVDLSLPNMNTLAGAMCLALGYQLKGKEHKKEKYLKFVDQHEQLLHGLGRQLCDVISKRMVITQNPALAAPESR
ncbi:hypothetical protein FXV77_14520 [Sphingobacterium phlebotomi]|uniref:Peptidase M50 domain-containing protein n=1 Tax=Sphingobacterium phlebotomi TaxID=2605433 RepID=A0A5D4H325_9SPHI|nr:M50 family metallopeptidase [Sphingobacterium phlebotomi]TYR34682.1 hypothetical protein FXV77_14520 [Sphingobacterium phlebotomi]